MYYNAPQALQNSGLELEFFHVPSATIATFKAFITDFSDNYTSNWNEENVYGRSDPIAIYQGTKRVISFSWDVVAASLGEALFNMKEIETLIKMTYPNYSAGAGGATSISSAPLIKVKFVNLITDVSKMSSNGAISTVATSGLVGKIDGVNYKPKLDDGVFQGSGNMIYPKVVSLSCAFTVFHVHPLGWSNYGFRTLGFPYGLHSADDIKAQDSKTAAATKNITTGLNNVHAKEAEASAQDITGTVNEVVGFSF